MPCSRGWKSSSAHAAPTSLIRKWARAARLAQALPTSAAMLAVSVVPMFSPITSAAAVSYWMMPFSASSTVSTRATLLLWVTMASAAPMSTKSRSEAMP